MVAAKCNVYLLWESTMKARESLLSLGTISLRIAAICASLYVAVAAGVASEQLKLVKAVNIVSKPDNDVSKFIVHRLIVTDHRILLAYSMLKSNGETSFRIAAADDQWNVSTLLRQTGAVASAELGVTTSGDIVVVKGRSLGGQKVSPQMIEWLSAAGGVRARVAFAPKVRAIANDGDHVYLLVGQNDGVYEVNLDGQGPRVSCIGTNLPRNHRIGSVGAAEGSMWLFDSTGAAAIKVNTASCQTKVSALTGEIIARQRDNYERIVRRVSAIGTVKGLIRAEFISAGARQSNGTVLLALTGFAIKDGVPVVQLDRGLNYRRSYWLPPLGSLHTADKNLNSATVRAIAAREGQVIVATSSGSILCFSHSR